MHMQINTTTRWWRLWCVPSTDVLLKHFDQSDHTEPSAPTPHSKQHVRRGVTTNRYRPNESKTRRTQPTFQNWQSDEKWPWYEAFRSQDWRRESWGGGKVAAYVIDKLIGLTYTILVILKWPQSTSDFADVTVMTMSMSQSKAMALAQTTSPRSLLVVSAYKSEVLRPHLNAIAQALD